jgi:ribosome assembly protein RRB1
MTTYLVTGSQADKPTNNSLYIMKLSQLHRTKHDDDDEASDDDDNDLDEDPLLEYRTVRHMGGVNRIRVRFTVVGRVLKCDNLTEVHNR